jgi:hypothetical protein
VVVLIALAVTVFAFLDSLIRTDVASAGSKLGLPQIDFSKSIFRLGTLLTFVFAAIMFWFVCRRVPRFKVGELGILFAPNFPAELEERGRSANVRIDFPSFAVASTARPRRARRRRSKIR